ncbi:MAG: nucleoside triphosphate pyrophosphohydrolase [Alphaproteobacteria bacterium]
MSETGPNIQPLLDVMARLRDPDGGCPWDVEQDFGTIAPYTIEEAYEVADAIERGDMPALKDELGDLLFQVVFHSRMAEEKRAFAFGDVVAAITDKMIRRHPHVFADADIRSEADQTIAWEAQKAAERAADSALDGVALSLPALMRAEKLQKRAARVGFDWPDLAPVTAKVHEELDEIAEAVAEGQAPARLEEEVGDLLFACVNLARHLGVDPESALRAGNTKFERRFHGVEARLRADGKTPANSTLDEMEAQWEATKRAESEGSA